MPAYESHTLSLYCDALDQHAEWRPGESWPVLFHHALARQCRKLAKEAGWKFLGDGRTVCPRCVKNKVRLGKCQK